MTNRGSFGQLLAPGLANIMFAWLREHPEEYPQYLKVETAEKGAYEDEHIVAGFGLARKKLDGEQVTFDDPIQGGSKRYIHETFAIAWQVTMEMLQDERYGIMRQCPAELIKSCRQLWEAIAASVLNNGFTTTVTGNGETLFNTVQPLLGGGTYSNRLSPDMGISVTALQDALTLYENMVNERGLKARISPKNLYFAPEQQYIVARTLQSGFLPGTGNNDINPVQGRLTPVMLHYLTSTTAWFIGPDTEENGLKFKWRMKPEVDSQDDFHTKGSMHSVVFRVSVGASHWKGWVASRP